MNKLILSLLLLLFTSTAIASENKCNLTGLKSASKPSIIQGVTFCLMYRSAEESLNTKYSKDPEAISIFFFIKNENPKFLYELPYSGTESIIEDTFVTSDKDGNKSLVIVHSSESPSTFETKSRLYDITVVDTSGGRDVKINVHANRFFGVGADLADSTGQVIFRYPYKTRKSIISALNSSIYEASHENLIDAVVESKSYLYNDFEPRDPTHMYLIAGDKVKVQDATAGMCKIIYQVKSKKIEKWIKCETLKDVR